MCLYISTKFHHSVNGNYRAKKVGSKPLLVWKLLEYQKKIKRYTTPYQYLPITFDNGMKAVEGIGFRTVVAYSTQVNEGVHAYRTTNISRNAIEKARDYCSWEFKQFPAIIPSGESYFIGKDGDIVASRMIIFRSKRSLDKYLNGKETITIED